MDVRIITNPIILRAFDRVSILPKLLNGSCRNVNDTARLMIGIFYRSRSTKADSRTYVLLPAVSAAPTPDAPTVNYQSLPARQWALSNSI